MKRTLFVLLIMLTVFFFCPPRLSLAQSGEVKTFIGTIESFRPVMGKPPKWYCARFSAVSDNGDKKEIWILGVSGSQPTSVTDSDGKPMDKPGYNHRPQVGRKVELAYYLAENGRNDAISIRYVPAGYVPLQAASQQKENPAPGTNIAASSKSENIFTGKIDRILPLDPTIRVIPDNGGQYMYFNLKDAAITDEDGKMLSFKDLRKDKRLEVKYSYIIGVGVSGAKTAKAVAVSYIPEDYVPQTTALTEQVGMNPASSATAASGAGSNAVVGKVVKGGVTFSLRCPYRFVIVTDNGEKKDIWIPKDNNMRITGLDGNLVYGAPPKKGRKMEIQYLIGEKGQYEAVSMRYVPEDYVR